MSAPTSGYLIKILFEIILSLKPNHLVSNVTGLNLTFRDDAIL